MENITQSNQFFVETMPSLGIRKYKTKDENTTDESKDSRLTFDLAAGYDYISVVPRVGFEYGHSKDKDSDIKYSTSNFFLSISTRINIPRP